MTDYDKNLIEAELNLTLQQLAENEAKLEQLQVIVAYQRSKVNMLKGLLGTDGIEDTYRTPTDMIRSEYKGMKLGDIIEKVLSDSPIPLTPKDIVSRIYTPHSEDEFDRARSSVSAEMRSGAKGKNPRWEKIGRSAYTSLSNKQLSC